MGTLKRSEYQLAFIHEKKNDSAIMKPKELVRCASVVRVYSI